MARILLIEPLNSVAGKLQHELRSDGHHVDRTPCGRKGLKMWLDKPYDLLVLDLKPEELDAEDVLTQLASQGHAPTRAIVYSDTFKEPAVLKYWQRLELSMPLGGELVFLPESDYQQMLKEIRRLTGVQIEEVK